MQWTLEIGLYGALECGFVVRDGELWEVGVLLGGACVRGV